MKSQPILVLCLLSICCTNAQASDQESKPVFGGPPPIYSRPAVKDLNRATNPHVYRPAGVDTPTQFNRNPRGLVEPRKPSLEGPRMPPIEPLPGSIGGYVGPLKPEDLIKYWEQKMTKPNDSNP